MSEFGLIDSFYVDDGELDGLSPANCFVLGCEWSKIIDTIDSDYGQLRFIVHSNNQFRIEKAIEKRNRKYEWTWPANDSSEDWIYLKVYSKEP